MSALGHSIPRKQIQIPYINILYRIGLIVLWIFAALVIVLLAMPVLLLFGATAAPTVLGVA